MKQLIEKIKERLTTPITTGDIILLKYVDEDREQMDITENHLITEFPAALIQIPEIEYESNSNYIQKGNATVIIRLFETKDTDEQEYSIWDLMTDINKRLYGKRFLPQQYEVLNRSTVKKIKREDEFVELKIYYTLRFTDNSCMPKIENHESPYPSIHIVKNIKDKITDLDRWKDEKPVPMPEEE